MFGKRIMHLRKQKGMTQELLANTLNISRSALSLYEIDKREPDTDTILKIATFFNVSTDYLIGKTYDVDEGNYTIVQESSKGVILIGNRLKLLREEAHIGQQELCNHLNIEQSTLANYENNRRTPKLDILIAIAKYFNVSTDYLLGLTNIKSAYNCNETSDIFNISEESSEYSPMNTNMPLTFKFNTEISNRLKDLASEQDCTYDSLADILGIEKATATHFFERDFVPRISLFLKIVEHFRVSADYLLNRTKSKLILQTDDEEKLLNSYRNLNDKSKIIALSEVYKLEREDATSATKERQSEQLGKSYPSNSIA